MITSTIRERLLASTVLVGVALIGATPAFAQQVAAADDVAEEAIVVTGSRISRPNLEAASPVNVIGETEIQLRQAQTAEELLRDLPGVRPAIGPGVNNGSNGSATIDLRGIGTNRTLVLLDGRRIVPFGLDGVVDTNVIPIALTTRVDVLTGGASTVYGADAVAGVVNFVTKRDFSGVDFSSGYRITERGDGASFRADLTIGGNFAEGRGNAVLSMGYTNTEALNQDERPFGEVALSSANGLPQGSTTGVPTFIAAPAIPGITDGSFGSQINPATGSFIPGTQANLYNFNPDNLYQTPLERYSLYGSARYEITDNIEAYATGFFTLNKVQTLAAPSGTFGNTFRVPLSNPYLGAGAAQQLCNSFGTFVSGTGVTSAPNVTPGVPASGGNPARPPVLNSPALTAAQCNAARTATNPGSADYQEVSMAIQRRFTEYGPRFNNWDTTTFQLQMGLRGNVFGDLKWDILGQYGESNQNQARVNWGSFSRVQQALRATNTTTCNDPANGCVPINLFGPEGSITPEQIGFFGLDAFIRRNVRQTVITGNLGGDVKGFQSPFAESPLAFSVGGEYRRLASVAIPDSASAIQSEVLGTGPRVPTDEGTISVAEVFGEVAVPLIENKPFFQSLTLEAGIRYSDYTTTAGSTTWKAGGSWVPVDGLKFRGMYQIAVRSPNINELFAGRVQGLSNQASDPCQGPITGALAALCVATGVPAGLVGLVPQPSAGQVNQTNEGNPNLQVERARTITFGGVFTPSFAPGLSFTADWFDIRVRDAITQPATGDILGGCYNPALNPGLSASNVFCQLVGRNPINGSLNGAGDTLGAIRLNTNLGVIRTKGLDLGLNYRVNVGQGTINFANNTTYLDTWNFQSSPNAINRRCVGLYSVDCELPRAQVRSNTRLTYSQGPFDLSVMWRYISRVNLEPASTATGTGANRTPPLTTPQFGGPNPASVLAPFRSIPAYNYFDLAFAVRAMDNLRINLTVNNLLDKQPPVVGGQVGGTSFNNGNTFPALYDVLGRSYQLGVNLRF